MKFTLALPVMLTILFLSGVRTQAQPNGVSFIANINIPHGGPGHNFGFYYASCWGYVAPDGHEYALVGCYGGTSIIDLDATPMQEVAFIPGANSEWKELKTWGNYAYVVSENGAHGLQIINLSQLPDTAWLVRSVSSVEGKDISTNHTITVADGYLYLNGSTSGGQTGGTIILNLADPENPTYEGQYQPAYLHDTYVRNDTLYGAAINGQGVYVASVASKRNPGTLGLLTYPGSGTHNAWAAIGSRYVFTTDEIGSTAKNMKVFDIANLPTFTQASPFTANPGAVIHNIHGRGNYVYIAHYAAGVYVADVHDPLNITSAGNYDTYTGGQNGYIGCWGVYPYFPSGRWIGSDTQTGLYVFSFNGLHPRIRSHLLSPPTGTNVNKSAPITFRWQAAALQNEDPHYYQLHIFGPGVNMYVNTRDTVATVGPIAGLTNNQQYSWHVTIRDEFTAVASPDTFHFKPTQVTQLVLFAEDWNMISVPLVVNDARPTALFPSGSSQAFGYTTGVGYATEDTLKNGSGYWLKFPSPVLATFTGLPRPTDSVAVSAGWNLIGTASVYAPTSAIIQIPSGIVESPFYQFSPTGYSSSTVLQPGLAYWVKVNQAGVLVLRAGPEPDLAPIEPANPIVKGK